MEAFYSSGQSAAALGNFDGEQLATPCTTAFWVALNDLQARGEQWLAAAFTGCFCVVLEGPPLV